MQACNIGTCDDGRIESANRISGHCCWGPEQVNTIFFLIWFVMNVFVSLTINVLYNRRKGIIVGNDQDGDDSVINALVSTPYSILQLSMEY